MKRSWSDLDKDEHIRYVKFKMDQVLKADREGHRISVPSNALDEPRNYTTSEAGYQPVEDPLLTVLNFDTQELVCLVCHWIRDKYVTLPVARPLRGVLYDTDPAFNEDDARVSRVIDLVTEITEIPRIQLGIQADPAVDQMLGPIFFKMKDQDLPVHCQYGVSYQVPEPDMVEWMDVHRAKRVVICESSQMVTTLKTVLNLKEILLISGKGSVSRRTRQMLWYLSHEIDFIYKVYDYDPAGYKNMDIISYGCLEGLYRHENTTVPSSINLMLKRSHLVTAGVISESHEAGSQPVSASLKRLTNWDKTRLRSLIRRTPDSKVKEELEVMHREDIKAGFEAFTQGKSHTWLADWFSQQFQEHEGN